MRKVFCCRFATAVMAVIVSTACYGGYVYWKKRNDGFCLERIQTKLPNSPEWDIPVSAQKIEEVNQILAQPFYYLGHGFQFYAFESSDGKYVLKFLRHQRLHPPVMYDWLPSCGIVRDIKAKKCLKRSERVRLLFQSLKIAYEQLSQESGLLFVHLNKTKNQHREAFLVDLQEDEHKIALDDTEFVLQHKATFVKPTIKAYMKAGNIDEAKARINQLFELLKATAQKGILDTDGALIYKNNVGFIRDKAIYIDVGCFVFKESIKCKERFEYDLCRLKPLYRWLAKNYPPLAAYFDKQQKKALVAMQEWYLNEVREA